MFINAINLSEAGIPSFARNVTLVIRRSILPRIKELENRVDSFIPGDTLMRKYHSMTAINLML